MQQFLKVQQYLLVGLPSGALALFLGFLFVRWRQKVEEERKRLEMAIAARQESDRKQAARHIAAKAEAEAAAKRRLEEVDDFVYEDYETIAQREWALEREQEKQREIAAQEARQREFIAARLRQLETQIQNAFYTWLATFHMIPPSPPYADSLIAEFMNSNYWPLPQDVGLLRNSQHPFVTRCIRCANSFPARFIPTVQ